jgi:rare lipoprotein A
MLQEGIAPVRIAGLGYKAGEGYKQVSSYDKGNYSIQVAAFSVKENAYRYMENLKKQYGSSDVQESWIKSVKYYRVRLGHFDSLKQAQGSIGTFEQKGFKGCFVVSTD